MFLFYLTPQKLMYEASIPENSAPSTPILRVSALDADEDEFGYVTYRLTGYFAQAFSIGAQDGTISVVDPSVLDREAQEFIVLQVVATDSAPRGSQRSSTVPVNITILDVNDNQPMFIQHDYSVTIVDNIPYYPEPSPITQVSAMDFDTGNNAKLYFYITSGNEEQMFFIDHDKGIVYPNASFQGMTGRDFNLVVEVTDEAGQVAWPQPDAAVIRIDIENVNTHKPEWFPLPPPDQTVEIPEESEQSNFVILKVNARDRDLGENQRISYFLKVNNVNVESTNEFSMNPNTGELRAIGRFDREEKERYELILVAKDHGTPVAFETLRFVTVMIKDINDNDPKFPESATGDNMVRFTVPEEEDPGFFVGRVKADDPDEGKNGRVFYYIIGGNDEHYFSVDKTYGNLYTKKRIDREKIDQFDLLIKATNNPDYVCEGAMCDIVMSGGDDLNQSVVKVQIFVEDKNDNLPRFENEEFFVGIPFNAKVGDLILDAKAFDPDLSDSSKLSYALRSSNLYRSGSTVSAGSLVPSPFSMEENGRLTLGSLMAEFNQDRFVIDIEAKDHGSNHRAKARVNLWIYEPEQLIKLVVARTPIEVNDHKDEIVSELRNVTENIIVIDDIKFHVNDEDGLRKDMTDMYLHAVDENTNEIIMPEEILKTVDANYDYLSMHYEEAGIHSILPASEVKTKSTPFDANLIALIALLILIFFGAIMFSILCCCMKSWVAKASTKPMKLRESPPIYNHASVLDGSADPHGTLGMHPGVVSSPISPTPAGGTDNPLWIDQKYKAYEEQELTMTVFSDQDNSVISGQNSGNGQGSVSRQSAHLLATADTQSNAYATINKLPMVPASRRSLFNGSLGIDGQSGGHQVDPLAMYLHPERDYATLEKTYKSPPGPLVPGIHSTPVIHQSSLPRRRFSNDFETGGPGANIIINKNGEPELVADLL